MTALDEARLAFLSWLLPVMGTLLGTMLLAAMKWLRDIAKAVQDLSKTVAEIARDSKHLTDRVSRMETHQQKCDEIITKLQIESAKQGVHIHRRNTDPGNLDASGNGCEVLSEDKK